MSLIDVKRNKPLILNPAAISSVFGPAPTQAKLAEIIHKVENQLVDQLDKFLQGCCLRIFPKELVELISKYGGKDSPLAVENKVIFMKMTTEFFTRCGLKQEETQDRDNPVRGPSRVITATFNDKTRIGLCIIYRTPSGDFMVEQHFNLDFNENKPILDKNSIEIHDFLQFMSCWSQLCPGATKLFREWYCQTPEAGSVLGQNPGN